MMAPLAGRVERGIREDIGWLLAIVGVALAIRIYFPWPLVFTPTHVNLLETDAWYHLRVIENLVTHFPHRLQLDPYALTDPQFLKVPPLLDFLVAGAAWIAGWGRPSEALVKTVAVFVPPVLGGLTVVAVYAVARLASGSLGGLLAAALAAILPGHFLDRTLLGYVDHHALESWVSTGVLCLVALPLARARPVARSGVWLGVGLAVFRLTWTSAAMIVAVLVVWLVVHTALQSWRRGGIGDAARIVGIAALGALLSTLAFPSIEPFGAQLQIASLSMLAVVAAAAEAGRYGLHAGWWSPRRLLALAFAVAAGATAALVWAFPATVGTVLSELSRFHLSDSSTSVLEARPLFMYEGTWSLRTAWDYFRSGFILGLGAIVFLAVRWVRRGQPLDLLLIVWTAAMYAATIGVNRFGYYLVPAVAIVGGCACAALLDAGRRAGGWRRSVAVIAVAAGAFGLNLVPAIATTVRPAGISSEWFPAFDWLRRQSEEPFVDPGYYYARYDRSPIQSASSTVMLWWDYGYGLIAAGHRVPVAIPTGSGATAAAQFFTEVDEERAVAELASSRARYVFMDEYLPFAVNPKGALVGKFQAMPEWAGVPTGRYYGVFFGREGNRYRPVYLFFEDYYRTMTFRLGVLGGQAVVPASTSVVSWTVEDIPGQGPSRVVSQLETFPTYEDAALRLQQLGPDNHAIVGLDPRASAVPFESVRGLRRAYATPAPGAFRQGAVQVFERSVAPLPLPPAR